MYQSLFFNKVGTCSCRNWIKFKRNASSTTKKLLKRKPKNITSAKANIPVSQTSSETLKVTMQIYQMENKELKMKRGKLQDEISRGSLPIKSNLSNDFKSNIFETNQRKISPFMRLFWDEQQNIYNLPQIMLNITQWLYVIVCRLHQNLQLLIMIYVKMKKLDWICYTS